METVGLVAGETSGDLLAGLLLQGLQARWPKARTFGIGGAQMRAQGFEAWWPANFPSGYWEVLPRLPELLRIRRGLTRRMLAARPDLFIGVDAPDFNFGLETRLRRAGIRTVHFVSPSFWAWRPKNLVRLKAAAEHVLCLFPFEPELLATAGVPATYVGHPLARALAFDPDPVAARRALGLVPDMPVLAILPGSRAAEIQYLAPRFFAAAAILRQHDPTLQCVVPVVPHVMPAVQAAARASGLGAALHLIEGQSHAVLAACDVALVASGTATLEAALLGRPMVIAYAMPAITRWLRLLLHERQLPWIGLPNILCAPRPWPCRPAGMDPHTWTDWPDAPFVVPELIQDSATPEALARAVQAWLTAPEKIARLKRRFAALHDELNRDTAQLTADALQTIFAR
ncbi:MAG: lipid-A-disaccharide synthase [Burkholderiaceae bacterium]|jgi:lipid-A-disaccharide synthase|nr:lipid-A-disaccharide synthase [Burkholderiaceae bacterium]